VFRFSADRRTSLREEPGVFKSLIATVLCFGGGGFPWLRQADNRGAGFQILRESLRVVVRGGVQIRGGN